MNPIATFIEWFLKYYLSPMVANASPVLVSGRYKIDLGRRFIDGKPLFGAGKTWEGFIVGAYMGFLASIPIQLYTSNEYTVLTGFLASVTALIGDIIGSFIKRRLGIKRGDPAPILDQLDFALMSTIYYWFSTPGFQRIDYIVYSLILILILHILTNNIAYYLGVKDRRW